MLNTFDQTIVSFSFLPLHSQKWQNHHKHGLLIWHLDFTGEEGRGVKCIHLPPWSYQPPAWHDLHLIIHKCSSIYQPICRQTCTFAQCETAETRGQGFCPLFPIAVYNPTVSQQWTLLHALIQFQTQNFRLLRTWCQHGNCHVKSC